MQVIKLKKDNNVLNLCRGDYVLTHDINFFTGTGIYELELLNKRKFARCIELLDGKIQVNFFNGTGINKFSNKTFNKFVRSKVFARIVLEGNISTVAIGMFDELLQIRKL